MIELPYFLECFSFSLFFLFFRARKVGWGCFLFFLFFFGQGRKDLPGDPGQQSVTSSRDPLAARSVRWGFAAVTMSPDKTQWTYQIVA